MAERAPSLEDDGDESIQEEALTRFKTEDIATSIYEKLAYCRGRSLKASSTRSFSSSICRVIRSLRQYNKDAYEPQLISIGPFHYRKSVPEYRRAMEEHKWKYLQEVLSRNPETILEQCLDAVKRLEKRARDCYSEVIHLDGHSFTEMMLIDGIFIIELFRKNWFEEYEGDPIFEFKLLKKAIMADLLMIENQIPFFILQRLFDLVVPPGPFPSLEMSAFRFFDELYLTWTELFRHSEFEIQHLLHLVHSKLVPLSYQEKTNRVPLERTTSFEPGTFKRILCASKLEEGGIEFRVKKGRVKKGHGRIGWDIGNFMDITFHEGVIEIPQIEVWSKTYILFLNLIAFEQCNSHCKKYVSAYTAFMDCLVNTSKDVEILSQNGIIDNGLGNEKRVAMLFNHMGRELTVYDEDFYLSGVCNDINEYSERTWPKLRASLVHDYFKNPWAIISFLAGLLLLFLTATQTFFSSFPKFAYGN